MGGHVLGQRGAGHVRRGQPGLDGVDVGVEQRGDGGARHAPGGLHLAGEAGAGGRIVDAAGVEQLERHPPGRPTLAPVGSSASQTSPMPPRPSRSTSSYGPIRAPRLTGDPRGGRDLGPAAAGGSAAAVGEVGGGGHGPSLSDRAPRLPAGGGPGAREHPPGHATYCGRPTAGGRVGTPVADPLSCTSPIQVPRPPPVRTAPPVAPSARTRAPHPWETFPWPRSRSRTRSSSSTATR